MIRAHYKHFPTRMIEDDPEIICRRSNECYVESFVTRVIRGRYFRVFPATVREIFLLQCLEMYDEKFAPSSGNGIIVSVRALEKIDA